MKLKLLLEYNGGEFCGWQYQPGQVTVQGELERALGIVLGSIAKKEGRGEVPKTPHVAGSGRTDSGVHARGQVASLLWPADIPFDRERVLLSMNAITPPGLVVRSLDEVPDEFDARHAPHIKCYVYRILLRGFSAGLYQGRAWRMPYVLDIEKMIRGAAYFRGRRDLSSFRAKDCTARSTVRTVLTSEIARPNRDELLYIAHGKGFLKHTIRIIVGTLVDVARGEIPLERIAELLENPDRARAGVTAPAEGLTLEWVRYGEEYDFTGENDPENLSPGSGSAGGLGSSTG